MKNRTLYWKSFDRKRQPFIRKAKYIFKKRLKEDFLEIQTELEGRTSLDFFGSTIDRILEGNTPQWKTALREVDSATIRHFGFAARGDVLKRSRFGMEGKAVDESDSWNWDRDVSEYLLNTSSEKIKEISETTKKQIQKIINDGTAKGFGIPEIAKSIGEEVDNKTGYRAVRIARTEVIGASNYGAIAGAESTELPMDKEWISTRDEKTRPEHAEADGQTTELDGVFVVGGEELAFPGDPGGSAENIIQCRCTIGFVIK